MTTSRVPMIVGAPIPKRPKQQESMTSAITNDFCYHQCCNSFCKCNFSTAIKCGIIYTLGVSPGKAADIRMKNLEQLQYMQQLMEDGMLTSEEFIEQKQIILASLCNLKT